MSDPLLLTHHLSKSFGQQTVTHVLQNVSLSIEKGELVSIVGPSGSGKSTLLYLLGALDRPTSGEIVLDKQTFSACTEAQLTLLRQQKMGFVFQSHFLLPEFTALENVLLPALLAQCSLKDAQQQAQILLERVGLTHRLQHRPSELSGGEKQRVAIARALINQPQLLLADEPTGNLDTENTQEVFGLIQDLNQERQQTVIMVTHNLELAAQTHRQIHLIDGKIQSA